MGGERAAWNDNNQAVQQNQRWWFVSRRRFGSDGLFRPSAHYSTFKNISEEGIKKTKQTKQKTGGRMM